MAKKKATKRPASKGIARKRASKPAKSKAGRFDASDFGIDLGAILRDEIKPRFPGSDSDAARTAGMSPPVLSHLVSGVKEPSLGALAALARQAGGRIIVTFEADA